MNEHVAELRVLCLRLPRTTLIALILEKAARLLRGEIASMIRADYGAEADALEAFAANKGVMLISGHRMIDRLEAARTQNHAKYAGSTSFHVPGWNRYTNSDRAIDFATAVLLSLGELRRASDAAAGVISIATAELAMEGLAGRDVDALAARQLAELRAHVVGSTD